MPALDGLRGIAAVIVVIRHCVNSAAMPVPMRRELFETPLVLLLNAQGAVQLFFVLSGWVLAASIARSGERAPWPLFYARRVLRIQLPYAAAVLFAWAMSVFWEVSAGDSVSPWLARSVVHPGAADVAVSLCFPGTGAGLLRVGWTLRVEMIFSLALPLLVLLARPARGLPLLAAALVLLDAPGRTAKYAIDFVLGIVAFQQRAALSAGIARLPAAARALLPVLGALLWIAPLPFGRQREGPLEIAVMGLGSVVLVAAAVALPGFSAALSRRPFLFLGRISYSLYLLHHSVLTLLAPILLVPTVVQFAGASVRSTTLASTLVLIGVVVASSILLSIPFHRLVERPAIALGHRISRGRRASQASAG